MRAVVVLAPAADKAFRRVAKHAADAPKVEHRTRDVQIGLKLIRAASREDRIDANTRRIVGEEGRCGGQRKGGADINVERHDRSGSKGGGEAVDLSVGDRERSHEVATECAHELKRHGQSVDREEAFPKNGHIRDASETPRDSILKQIFHCYDLHFVQMIYNLH